MSIDTKTLSKRKYVSNVCICVLISIRLQAENVGWDVAAVITLNRESFGPKGPLEVSSELLIQHASRGELHAVSQILQTGLVHPDVADSQGHTALIAATVTHYHYFCPLFIDIVVIHLLFDWFPFHIGKPALYSDIQRSSLTITTNAQM